MNDHRQRLELTIDLFKGCANSCAGCMVDRELGGNLSDVAELVELSKGLVADGFIPFDVAIGPTDIMSSGNAREVLFHEDVQKLIEMFNAVTLNAAFLEKRAESYVGLARLVDEAIGNKNVRFLIPAAPAMFSSRKFGPAISERVKILSENLELAHLHEAGFVVNCTRETLAYDYASDLSKGFELDFAVPKDDILNIPYGRGKIKDILMSSNVLAISRSITSFYETLDGKTERTSNPDLCPNTGTMLNLLYSDGKLYWIPFLKDEFVFFDPLFEIKRPWTKENVLKQKDDAIASSMDYVISGKCGECPYLASCSEKGIHRLMEVLSIRDCLVGLEDD